MVDLRSPSRAVGDISDQAIPNSANFPVVTDVAGSSAEESGRSIRDTLRSVPSGSLSEGSVPAPSRGLAFHALPYREIRRRFWHMTPGLLPFALQLFSHADPISPTMYVIAVGCCVVIGLRILTSFRQIQRVGEGTGASAVAGYALSVLFTIVMFPAHMEIGMGVLSILAFGDGSATLFGLMLRGPRLPWNSAKSWSGLLAFWVIGSVMSAWSYAGETWNPEALDPPVSFGHALIVVLPAVVASGLAESARTRINDNIRVGVVAAFFLTAMHFLTRSF